MTAAWMMYALAIGALIAIAAVSAEWALKSAQRPVRFVWISAIALTVLFTVVAPYRVEPPTRNAPSVSLALPADVVVSEHQPTVLEGIVINIRQATQLLARPVQRVMTMAIAASDGVNRSATIVWITSSFVSLLVLITVYARFMRESARWPRMQVLGRSVRVAPDVGPAVIGMAPPEIVIPRWVLRRTPEEQRLVLEHEAEHVRAHDPILLVVACVAVALMPWHAALWFMWSRLRLAVELDCDRRVLQRGVLKPAYGELLVELSGHRPWDSLVMPAFSWGTSHLEKRLVAMTARPVRFAMARRVVSVGVVAAALLAACQSELPTTAEIQSMDATAVATRLQKVSDSVEFFVDGKTVSAADAKAIASDDIGSIEVLKKSAQRAVSEIHITRMTDSMRVLNAAKMHADSGVAKDSTVQTILARRERDSGTDSAGMRLVGDTILLRFTDDSAPRTEALLKPRAVRIGATNSAGSVQTLLGDSVLDGKQVLLRGNTQCPSTTRVLSRGQASSACDPLIIVDGVIVNMANFSTLNRDQIESVEVVKGAAAVATHGPAAVNGIISIKLKR